MIAQNQKTPFPTEREMSIRCADAGVTVYAAKCHWQDISEEARGGNVSRTHARRTIPSCNLVNFRKNALTLCFNSAIMPPLK